MIVPLIYRVALGYLVASILGGLTYAGVRYRTRTLPVIHREHSTAGRRKLVLQWRGHTYASWDGYEWMTMKGKPVSRRASRKFQNFVLTYGWSDV